MLMNFEMRQGIFLSGSVIFFDHQRPSGQIPAIAPTGGWGYNWGTGPSFDGFVIRCPYLICKYTNDSRAIVKYWNNMQLYMQYLESMAEDYILDFRNRRLALASGNERNAAQSGGYFTLSFACKDNGRMCKNNRQTVREVRKTCRKNQSCVP